VSASPASSAAWAISPQKSQQPFFESNPSESPDTGMTDQLVTRGVVFHDPAMSATAGRA
jgi:hypothetical protein